PDAGRVRDARPARRRPRPRRHGEAGRAFRGPRPDRRQADDAVTSATTPPRPASAAADALADPTRAALAELLLTMADDEFVSGFTDSEWTGIAPLLEEAVAISSISQDELGHARALCPLLAHAVDAPSVFTPRDGEAELLEAGILTRSMATSEAAWRADLTTILVPLGLALPPTMEPTPAGRRDHSDAFSWLWSEFTSVRRSEEGVTW